MNNKPCETCNHYDVIMRGTGKGLRTTKRGWCAKKSVYPTKPGPGQIHPAGVKHVANASDLAKPVIVRGAEVATNCTDCTPRKTKESKADLIKKLQSQGGKRVLKGM